MCLLSSPMYEDMERSLFHKLYIAICLKFKDNLVSEVESSQSAFNQEYQTQSKILEANSNKINP